VAELYQRIPTDPRATFGDQLALGCHDWPPILEATAGATLDLDLWWQAVRLPAADYSVGVYLLAADGRTIAQQDGGFDRARIPAVQLPADRWTPDARALFIPPDTPPGTYTLAVAVYDWRTGERLLPAPNAREARIFVLGEVQVQSQDACRPDLSSFASLPGQSHQTEKDISPQRTPGTQRENGFTSFRFVVSAVQVFLFSLFPSRSWRF